MSDSTSVDAPRRTLNLLQTAAILIFGLATLLYTMQLFTPLRLTTDGIRYLSLADSGIRGHGLSTIAAKYFFFPKGYPVFLFGMMKLGIFSSAVLVASNLVFLWLALVLSFQTLTANGFQREVAAVACLFTYLSYAAIKHVTQAMSDFLFFSLAAGAFWLINRKGPYRWLAVLPALGAVEVRLLGLALFVPIAFVVWQSAAKRPKLLIAVCAVLVCCLGVGLWAGRRYFSANSSLLRQYGVGHFLWYSGVTHCEDFGQLVFNVPWTKLPGWTAVLIIGTGVIAIIFLMIGVIALFKSSPMISLYLVGCSVLIFPWPYTDPRFWLPVMPYVVVAIWIAVVRIFEKVPDWTLVGYTALFSIAGFAALGYSTWITFSGPQFPYRYGDGLLRSAYIAHCSGSPAGNQDAIDLLRRYEWHCVSKE